MTAEAELHQQLESLYRRTGVAAGYWPNYFLRAVRGQGGLAVAKSLLAPGEVRTGFGRLAEAHRADLSVEAVACSDRFAHLFTPAELAEAKRRLAELPDSAFAELLPDRTEPGVRSHPTPLFAREPPSKS